jgi:hypothetical protein
MPSMAETAMTARTYRHSGHLKEEAWNLWLSLFGSIMFNSWWIWDDFFMGFWWIRNSDSSTTDGSHFKQAAAKMLPPQGEHRYLPGPRPGWVTI